MGKQRSNPIPQVHFRSRLVAAVVFPLVLLVIASVLLTAQIVWLTATARKVAQSDRITAQASQTQRLIVDMESGVRGYLLTGDAAFLAPYEVARDRIDDEFKSLMGLLTDSESERQLAQSALDNYKLWFPYSQDLIKARDSGATEWVSVIEKEKTSKLVVDMRSDLTTLIQAERDRRTERNQSAIRATRIVVAASIGISLIVGLLIALSTVRQLMGLSHNYANAIASLRRQSEALRDSEERLRAIFEQAPVGIVQTDLEGYCLRFNERLCEMSGYSRAELEKMKISDLTHPEEREDDAVQWASVVKGEIPSASTEKRLMRKGGSVLYVGVTTALIGGADGRDRAVLQTIADLTARRYLVGPLRRIGSRFKMAADVIGIGTWDYNLASGEAIWSERQEQLFGLAPGTFAGTGDAFLAMVHPDDREGILAAGKKAVDERTFYRCEYRLVRPDGSVRWYADSGDVICGGEEKLPTHIIGVTVDITDRKLAAAES